MRCSGLARPMICAGYVFLDLPEDNSTNHAAEEGTAAGEYLERLLTSQPIGSMAKNGVHFDDDMKFYTTPIAESIFDRAATKINCEHEIDWPTRSGIKITGHPDITFIDKRGFLCIEDLKYGFGIVEVKENWQLLGYAIGEVIRLGKSFEKISLKIHQPRPHHEDGYSREWLITYSELLIYKEKIEVRMQSIVDGNKHFQTGNNCKYCLGAGEACPAFNRLFYRALEVSTGFVQDSLTDEELASQLDHVKRAEEVIKIKKDSLTELGVMRIKQGRIIPGYAQTQKFSNRAWKPGVSPEAIKAMTGKNVMQERFMSPAQVEKLGIPRKVVSQLAEKKLIGMKLTKQDSTELGNKIFGGEVK